MRATLAINELKANVKQNETKELVVPMRSTHFQNLKRNCQATYQKGLCFLFEKSAIFSQSERRDKLDPPPLPVRSCSLFQDLLPPVPLHNERTFSMTPLFKKNK